MNASSQKTLNIVRSLLVGPGGADAALALLERRKEEQTELHDSAVIWACLADLRLQVGNETGAREAANRASALRAAPIRLSFDDIGTSPSKNLTQRFTTNITSPQPHVKHSLRSVQAVHITLARSRELKQRCSSLLESVTLPESAVEHTPSRPYGLRRSAVLGRLTAALLQNST